MDTFRRRKGNTWARGPFLALAFTVGVCCGRLTALADGPHVPVPLDEMCNAAGPVDASSLPPAGQETLIGNVPFALPARDKDVDHVDVGTSIFGLRAYSGYGYESFASRSWSGSPPERLMLEVPKHAYRRAWIVAACDGEPNSTPVMTIRFFRPGKGWPLDSVVRVPEFTAQTCPEGAKRIAVKMEDGTPGTLWLLPVDIDSFRLASDFREVSVLNVELTKEVKGFRLLPWTTYYGTHQAGLPSAVRLYGLTFEKAPVAAIASSDRAGNVYTDPEKPVWVVKLNSQSAGDCEAEVSVDIVDAYGAGSDAFSYDAKVPAGGQLHVLFYPRLSKYGLHKVRTTVTCQGHVQSREGALLFLPPDRRKADKTTSRWGLWNWGGGHSTNPNPEDNLRLCKALGAKIGSTMSYEDREKWGIGPKQNLTYRGRMPGRRPPEWAEKVPYDPAEYAAFSEEIGKKAAAARAAIPDLEYATVYAEHTISLRLTHGVPPYAFGLPWYEYTEAEKLGIRSRFIGAKAAFEGLRKHAPEVKGLFGWGYCLFGVPFMREQFPKDLFDGFGLDIPQFERMPEMPPQRGAPNILYFLTHEMKLWGYEDKEIVHCESYFPPSLPLALGHRGQADSVVRTAVLSLALGSDRFVWCWTLHDCEDQWGSTLYGCSGMIGRRPEYDPKPAAAAYATMTQMLDMVDYDGYLPTGSRTAYCVRFKAADRLVYCLWTIRGSRPIALSASPGSELVMVDENGNETALEFADGAATVTITPTPMWVVARGGEILEAAVGAPTYTEAPGPHRLVLDDFDKMRWTHRPGRYPRYDECTWEAHVTRVPGPMSVQSVKSPQRKSGVMRVKLAKAPDDKAPLVSWYGVYTPPEPIPIPGKARALGVWVKGNSGWGRVIYELVDARGETHLNCGKEGDNPDDIHSWSSVNFDGWRYTEFPLPGSAPGDDCREPDSVWWNPGAEGVVDLPLRLNKIMFEMQTHQVYVDEMLPCESLVVELDDLMAVYDSAEMMTDKPVEVQRAAAGAVK